MNNPIINLEGVDLNQMNQQVFSNITLKINAGEFIYLIGETGINKKVAKRLTHKFYKEDILTLEKLIEKDLQHWLS